jgi:hypothetical protein
VSTNETNLGRVLKNDKPSVFQGKSKIGLKLDGSENGRYPAQTFIDSGVAECLDRQSGVLKGSDNIRRNKGINETCFSGKGDCNSFGFDDIGGCSKILHKCDYDEVDYDLFLYCPKVSKRERNKGLEGMEERIKPTLSGANKEIVNDDVSMRFLGEPSANFHPTVKPQKLLRNILNLFKTPNKQVVLDCFLGSGSTGVACKSLDFDFIGIELDSEYFEIAKNRIGEYVVKTENKVVYSSEVKPKLKPQLNLF